MSALADMGKFIIFGTSVLALFALGGGDDEDDFKVETDPRSTDFGKIRKGDTRYDIWGGFQQYVRLLSQFLSGSAKSSKTGVVRKLDGQGIFGTTRMDIVTRFIRGKFAPVPAGIANIGYGKDMIGNEVEVGDEVGKFITPLVIKDMVSAMKIKDIFDVKQTLQDIKENGAAAVFTVGLPASLGVGVSVIDLTAKEIDDIPGIGQSTEDRLKDKGIKSLDDLVKKRSTLKALKFEDKNGKMKKIFDAKTLKVIDSVINQMKIKKK